MKVKKLKHIFYYILTLSAFLLLPVLTVCAQRGTNVFIEGTTPLPAGEEVRLIIFEDYFSGQQKTVAKDKISKNGKFKLAYKTDHIQLAQLAIRNCKAEFYLAPNRTYHLEIDMDSQLFNMLDPGSFGGYLQIKNTHPDTSDLNLKINHFSLYFYDALNYFYPSQNYFSNQNSYDSIFLLVRENFPLHYNPDNFYLSYIYYTMGIIDLMMFHKHPDTIYNRYFNNDHILYNNPAYMNLFKDFYKNFLYYSSKISKTIINKTINISPDYTALFNEAGKDPFLVNERIRELVLIYNLWGFYNHEEFDNQHLIFLLHHIKKTTHFPEHIPIITNILDNISLKQENKSLENISLKKQNGGTFKLSSLKGKWVFIQFFNTHCTDCIREMMVLKALHEKWEDKISFVSISLDCNQEDFFSFANHYKMFDWIFLHFDYHYDWIETLGVFSLPENILLNPEGKIVLRNAPDITHQLSRFLLQMFPEEEKKSPLFYYRQND